MRAVTRGIGGLAALLFIGPTTLAGDLNPPPGPVSPTDDVVLNAQAIVLPYVITQPGAYRLTSSFAGSPTDGIQIAANDVWLDLGGFVLDGLDAAGNQAPGDGIVMTGPFHNCTILNGSVINWGDDGIDLSQGSDNRIINLSVRNSFAEGIECNRTEILDTLAMGNGFDGMLALDHSMVVRCRSLSNQGSGISVDNGSKVENCLVQFNDFDGIFGIFHCLVINCTASDNGFAGVGGVGIMVGENSKVANCTAARNQMDGIVNFLGGITVDCVAVENVQVGIFTDVGGMITNCKAARNEDGFHGILGAKIVECTATENLNWGYFVDQGTTVRECNANLNATTGIYAGDHCEIENNHVWQNGGGAAGPGVAGIEIFNALPVNGGTRVSNNDVRDNPTNYFCTTVGPNTFFGNTSTVAGPGGHFNIVLGNDVAPVAPGAAVAVSRVNNIVY